MAKHQHNDHVSFSNWVSEKDWLFIRRYYHGDGEESFTEVYLTPLGQEVRVYCNKGLIQEVTTASTNFESQITITGGERMKSLPCFEEHHERCISQECTCACHNITKEQAVDTLTLYIVGHGKEPPAFKSSIRLAIRELSK